MENTQWIAYVLERLISGGKNNCGGLKGKPAWLTAD